MRQGKMSGDVKNGSCLPDGRQVQWCERTNFLSFLSEEAKILNEQLVLISATDI